MFRATKQSHQAREKRSYHTGICKTFERTEQNRHHQSLRENEHNSHSKVEFRALDCWRFIQGGRVGKAGVNQANPWDKASTPTSPCGIRLDSKDASPTLPPAGSNYPSKSQTARPPTGRNTHVSFSVGRNCLSVCAPDYCALKSLLSNTARS